MAEDYKKTCPAGKINCENFVAHVARKKYACCIEGDRHIFTDWIQCPTPHKQVKIVNKYKKAWDLLTFEDSKFIKAKSIMHESSLAWDKEAFIKQLKEAGLK